MTNDEIVQAKREGRYAMTRVSEEIMGDLVVRGGMRVRWIGLPADAIYISCHHDWMTQSFAFKWLHMDFEITPEGCVPVFLESVCELLPRETTDE